MTSFSVRPQSAATDPNARPLTRNADDFDVPPTVRCPRCGRAETCICEELPSHADGAPVVAWEGLRGGWSRRLWSTALASSTEPQRTFGELPEGELAPAFAFALIAEALAIGSLALTGAAAAVAVAPELSVRVLTDGASAALILGVLVSASVFMVGLHALWGICLELGARSAGAASRFRQGMRFGLYACGWDLLTSPAGVLQGLASRGFVRAWPPIFAAVRAPRLALRAYVESCRRLGPSAERRGIAISVVLLGGVMFGVVGSIVVALLRWLG